MQQIIGQALTLLVQIFGDATLAKWVAALQFWLREKASAELKKRAAEEYERYCLEWDTLKALRHPTTPEDKESK